VIWKSSQARLEQRLLVLQAHAADVAGGVGESKQVLQRLLNTLQDERAVADQAADSEKARQLVHISTLMTVFFFGSDSNISIFRVRLRDAFKLVRLSSVRS
jgi:hypothetical protein